ncbi:hypothetical protein Cfor_03445 [Coptotermes formosanus]|uniref:Uncharacterized protein n=1 Tax=Coptotermes formosanus TaxID=36987 RepID=A0A6L2PSD2_COPFO|nr:hypothetical protein Cfor_03445 [Coptotermes formosanus]
MVTTISWGVPTLQARLLPAQVDETPPSPSDSKDEFHTPVAITESSTLCPSADRPILEEDGTVEDRENGNAAVLRGL